jgi:hypothetical protein
MWSPDEKNQLIFGLTLAVVAIVYLLVLLVKELIRVRKANTNKKKLLRIAASEQTTF